MPSPACEVKDGAAAYVATTDGVDVTPGHTIIIRLADSNVDQWEIQCITTDDSNSAATIQAALSTDSLNKTATFTAPSAGAALRFRSRVQGGLGPDGSVRSSYTTTFCIYTLVNGYRVIAADETTEGSAFGWVTTINDMARAGGGGATLPINLATQVSGTLPVANGGTGVTSLTLPASGLVVGTTDSQTLTGKTINGASNTLTVRLVGDVTGTLPIANGGTGVTSIGANMGLFWGTPSSANLAATVTDETGSGSLVFGTGPTLIAPTISSTPVLSGASTSTSNNAKGTAKDVNPVNFQTTDATVTTLDSFTIASNSAVAVSWLVTAIKSDASAAAAYSVSALFKNNAGTVAQVGTTAVTVIGETNSAWDCTADNSTTTIRLRVTGVAATTIQWTAILTSLTVIP